jgi:hypothetical protein
MNTKSLVRSGCVTSAVLLLAACASMRVGSDQHPQADFSGYRTFAWMAEAPAGGSGQVQLSALTLRRIREAVEGELSAKGYRHAAGAGAADFLVSFTVGTRERMESRTRSIPIQEQGPSRQWSWLDVDVHFHQEGTLSIDIFDGASAQPVWHGWATKTVTDADQADPGPVIQRAVSQILEKLPGSPP